MIVKPEEWENFSPEMLKKDCIIYVETEDDLIECGEYLYNRGISYIITKKKNADYPLNHHVNFCFFVRNQSGRYTLMHGGAQGSVNPGWAGSNRCRWSKEEQIEINEQEFEVLLGRE